MGPLSEGKQRQGSVALTNAGSEMWTERLTSQVFPVAGSELSAASPGLDGGSVVRKAARPPGALTLGSQNLIPI